LRVLLSALSLLVCGFLLVEPRPAFAEGERGTVSTLDEVDSSSPDAQGLVSLGTCSAGGSHTCRVTIEVPATSTEDGVRRFTCTKCGYTFTQTIPHTGHTWSDWEVDAAPTCVSAGAEHRTCQSCGEVETREIPALSESGSHTWVEVDRQDPTVEQEGWILWKCSVCGATYTETLQRLVQKEAPAAEVVEAAPVSDEGESSEPEEEVIASVDPPADESPEDDSAKQWRPNALDYALAAVDGAAVAVTAAFVVPLLAPLAWIRRRKDEARANARAESGEGEGA
jgi:transposase-like protein